MPCDFLVSFLTPTFVHQRWRFYSSSMSPTSASGRTSGHHSPISGAAPTHEYEDPVLRAISRRQTGRSSFDPLTRKHSVKFAFTSPDYSPSPDDTLLEPLPFERVSTSLSEVFMTHTATFESGIDLSRFGGHRDTFAILGLRRKQSRDLSLPTSFFERLLRYIDFETYLAIRVSCRSWSEVGDSQMQARRHGFTLANLPPDRLPSLPSQATFCVPPSRRDPRADLLPLAACRLQRCTAHLSSMDASEPEYSTVDAHACTRWVE